LAVREEEHRQTVRRLIALCEELAWLKMAFNMAISDLKTLYPSAFSGGFGEWIINDDNLSQEALLVTASRLSIPSLPAADAFLALSYVDDAYDMFGEITILTRELLTLKNAASMLSPARSNYFNFLYQFLGKTHTHAMQATTAVRHNRANERLFEMKIDEDLQFNFEKHEVVQETYRRQESHTDE
jgi:hypothetical protein